MYRNYLIFIGLFLTLVSCQKSEADLITQDIVITENNKLLMIKLDYLTHEFEGATELNFNSLVISDTIPMEIIYNPPGDFGDISITHIPTEEPIFFGTIIWMGLGERTFPEEFSSPSEYIASDDPVDLPEIEEIKFISTLTFESGLSPTFEYSNSWDAVSNLQIVEQYLANGAKIALIEYTPSVGVGDPSDWDWYYLFYL